MSKKITLATGFVSAVLLLIYNIYTRMTVLLKSGIASAATKMYMIPGIVGVAIFLIFLGFLFFSYGNKKAMLKLSAAGAFFFYMIAQLILWVYSFRSPLLKLLPQYSIGMVMLQIGFTVLFLVAMAAVCYLLSKQTEAVAKVLALCSAVLFALNGLISLLILFKVHGNTSLAVLVINMDLDNINGVAVLLLYAVFAAFLIAEWTSLRGKEKRMAFDGNLPAD